MSGRDPTVRVTGGNTGFRLGAGYPARPLFGSWLATYPPSQGDRDRDGDSGLTMHARAADRFTGPGTFLLPPVPAGGGRLHDSRRTKT